MAVSLKTQSHARRLKPTTMIVSYMLPYAHVKFQTNSKSLTANHNFFVCKDAELQTVGVQFCNITNKSDVMTAPFSHRAGAPFSAAVCEGHRQCLLHFARLIFDADTR